MTNRVSGHITRSNVLVTILSFLILGCSSFAHYPYACRATADSNPYKFPYLLVGNIAQVDQCAVFKKFRVELGSYYAKYKTEIDEEVKLDKGLTTGWPDAIYNFGRAFNCPEKQLKEFNLMVLKNKEDIFGKDYVNSARHVTLTVRKLIDENDELRVACN